MTRETTLLTQLGGDDGIRAIVAGWYPTVLADPLLHPLFGDGHPDHIDHLTAFLIEVFGGATRYTDELGGFPALLEAHRGLAIEDDQRRRFSELFLDAFDAHIDNAELRKQFADYLEFGTEVAAVNSHAQSADELHPCQEVPRWP